MLLRHGRAGPLSVLLSIFDRGGDHTPAWTKRWPVLPLPLLLLPSPPPPLSPPHVALQQLYIIGGWPSMGNESADSSVSREIKVQVWLLCGSSPVLPVLSRPLLHASFQEVIDNGPSTAAARGGAVESGDRCPSSAALSHISLSNYPIKTRVWCCGDKRVALLSCQKWD